MGLAAQMFHKAPTTGEPDTLQEPSPGRPTEEQKEKELQHKALMASMFNKQVDKKGRAFDPVAKKKAKEAEEEALAAGKKLKEEVVKAIIEGIANTIRLTDPKKGIRMSELGGHPIMHALKEKHANEFKTIQLLLFIKAQKNVFWIDDEDSTNPTLRCKEDVDAETAPDERSIEEIIEERRQRLGPGGTPVTKETFKAWKEKRDAERAAKEEQQRTEAKKSGGKTAVGMSGRDLFTYDASLFVDDDDAVDEKAYADRVEGPLSDREREDEDEESDDDSVEDAAEEGGARGSGDGAPGAPSSSARQEGDAAPIDADVFLEEGQGPRDPEDEES
ncbi:unnamed protein product [Prorocentrum cordatum]|uniref:ZC3H15/TMA46 family C-terminal domain-containing protein n=1 Tax=Prorocentrum cordatum TaxID=2364126 RepID=A0ABN9TSJ5_9DINO|nr:unnamed protein product [Polarella glacialis]